MAWSDLLPEAGIVGALDHAGTRPEHGDQNAKRAWSEAFADGCAVAIASEFRRHRELRRKTVKPATLAGGTEPVTPLGAGVSKRIDVTVADAVLGLELGVSLKGFNFVDAESNNYDKNITGRLYELGDEVRVVHEHLPHAFMVAVLVLPLASCADKRSARSPSSFASTVLKLRARSGRLDAVLAGQASKCDAGYVALYSHGEAPFERGVVRFFDVKNDPPKRGRPRIEATLSLAEMVDDIIAAATNRAAVTWAEAEEDSQAELAPNADVVDEVNDNSEGQTGSTEEPAS